MEIVQRQPVSKTENPPVYAPAAPGAETVPSKRWEQINLCVDSTGCSPPVNLLTEPAGCTPAGLPSDQQVTTQAVTYIGSLFVPERVTGKNLNFLVDTGCTHHLLSRTVFDHLPAQTRQQMVYRETVAAIAVAYTYMGALACQAG